MTVIDSSSVETLPQAPVGGLHDADELVIRPMRGWIGIDWPEIFRFRELLFFLVWRDLKVRYKQTILGVVWVIIQPVVNTALIVLLDRVANITSDGYPRALYIYAGILPWTFFSTGVSLGGMSLVNQTHLLTKVYFPRLFVPTASVGAGLMDMLISFLMFGAMMATFRFMPSWQIILLPLLVGLTILATLGATYLLASLTVSYRDFRYVIPFMIQGLMFLSPVLLPVSMIKPRYQWLLALNPMVGIINGFRSAIFGAPWNLPTLGISSAMALALFIFGLFYFRRTERRFADIA